MTKLLTTSRVIASAAGIVTAGLVAPQPAAWALMLAGAAALGLALRSRRRAALAA